MHRRRRSGARLPESAAADGGELHSKPCGRAAGRSPLPHRRRGAFPCRRPDRVPGPAGLPGEGTRLSHRAGRGGSGPRPSSGGPRGGGGGRRSAPDRLRRHPGARRDRRAAGLPAPDPPRAHGAVGRRLPGGFAAGTHRQGRSGRVAGARAGSDRDRGALRGAAQPGGGGAGGHLVESLNAIVARHEALRTTFATHEGKPYQVIAAALRLELPVVDLRRLPRAAGDGEGRRLAVAEGRISFDLARGPLLRAILLRLEEEHLLLLSMHHIVADGWSLEILRRELAVLYEAFFAGRPCPLPDLRVQYADCALWQRRWLEGETLEAQLAYWRDRLREPLPVLELPADRPRRTDRAARGGTCSAWLPESTAEGLRSLSREAGATLFMTMLAALDTLLHRYTGQTDLLVGTPVANRSWGESEGLIGFLVNTLVLRADLAGDPTFRELLARVRELALGAYAHADVPFEKLVEELKPERAVSRTPLFRVMLLVRNAPDEAPPAGGRLLEPVEIHNQTAQFDLTLAVFDGGRELTVGLEYDRGLFEPATVERMLMHFRNLLTEIVADPEQRLSELALGADGPVVRAAVPGVGEEPSARPAEVPTAEAAMEQPGDPPERQARLSQRRARLSAEQRELLRRRLRRQ
ncbi:MAG: hypothetical protein GY856_51880 [bacterium]|nr:hypothetical protein [bacterium]